MRTNEYFRQKVNQLLDALKRVGFKDAVASQANLIVAKQVLSGDKVVNLDVKAVNQQTPTEGQIYLQSQDVFLAEKIAYYRKIESTGNFLKKMFSSSDLPIQLNGTATETHLLYNGTIAFIQNRTIVSSLLSLQEFVKRKNTAIAQLEGVPDFFVEDCSKTLMPYWLLSGQRDNQIQIEYQVPLDPSKLEKDVIYVNIKGVLIPNAAQALGNIDLGL
jgi:hypothetical protein